MEKKSHQNRSWYQSFVLSSYIGNDYAYNNYAKNISFLEKLANFYNSILFSTIGNKALKNINHYGWLNLTDTKNFNILRKYDFLIQTSKHDANPSTILEAMSWGLIPVISKECGYHNVSTFKYIEINSINRSINTLKKLQNLTDNELIKLQKKNLSLIKNKYNWEIFRKKILNICLRDKDEFNQIYYTKKEVDFFENAKKNSPNYYLKFNNTHINKFIKIYKNKKLVNEINKIFDFIKKYS